MNKTEERRIKILKTLIDSEDPINGTKLAEIFGVSRQVIVQDIAILKEKSNDIISTNRGYKIYKNNECKRVLKVAHSDDEIEDELNIIVDLGATVRDVFISHKTYGKINVDLNIKSRRDGKMLYNSIKEGVSKPLKNLTEGYHYHTIVADSEEILDEVEKQLKEAGYVVD